MCATTTVANCYLLAWASVFAAGTKRGLSTGAKIEIFDLVCNNLGHDSKPIRQYLEFNVMLTEF